MTILCLVAVIRPGMTKVLSWGRLGLRGGGQRQELESGRSREEVGEWLME